MRLKCPCCRAEFSLEAALENEAAATALAIALNLHPAGKLIGQYLALFRPEKSGLSWGRVEKILGELLPKIQAGAVSWDGNRRECPVAVWAEAIEAMLARRHTLSLPMPNHNYLYHIAYELAGKASARVEAQRHEIAAAGRPDAPPSGGLDVAAQQAVAHAARLAKYQAGALKNPKTRTSSVKIGALLPQIKS
jgi:hypothetical protein